MEAAALHASRPVPVPVADGGTQLLERSYAFSLVGAAGTGVIVEGALRTWVDSEEFCSAVTFQIPQFASGMSLSAWRAADLTPRPRPDGPTGTCVSVGPTPHEHVHPETIGSDGLQPVDVASLPRDAATLEHALTRTATGLAALDQWSPVDDSDAPFERAALLLLAPLRGAPPEFTTRLDDAIALLPGLSTEGRSATGTGPVGDVIEGGRKAGSVQIVIDPSSGRLLEERNLDSARWRGMWAQMIASSFAGPVNPDPLPPASVSTEVAFDTAWIDPTGSPTLVPGTAVSGLRQLLSY